MTSSLYILDPAAQKEYIRTSYGTALTSVISTPEEGESSGNKIQSIDAAGKDSWWEKIIHEIKKPVVVQYPFENDNFTSGLQGVLLYKYSIDFTSHRN